MHLPPEAEIDPELTISFRLNLEPRGKGRPRAIVRKRRDGSSHLGAMTDDKTVAWKEDFVRMSMGARRHFAREIAGLWGMPIYIELELYFKRPKKAEWFCTSSVDNDNAEKNVWDAMQNTVTKTEKKLNLDIRNGFFKNDNRIIANATFKAWSEGEPYIRIRVAALRRKTS